MSEHKFEPFDRVLVRSTYNDVWAISLFSHYGCDGHYHFVNNIIHQEVVPYTPETAHLLGTSNPYEPPKPPHEYKWGDKVEVLLMDGQWWGEAIYLQDDDSDTAPIKVLLKDDLEPDWVERDQIRPLEPSHD